jgi:transketolase N-terminal domain/subunit
MGAIKLKANLNRRWVGVGLSIAVGMALGFRRSMSSRDPITALETAETPNQVVGTDF